MVLKQALSLFFGPLCLMISSVSAQDQKIADSLKNIYLRDTTRGNAKFELLKNLSYQTVDYKEALKYADELITLAEGEKNNNYLRVGYYLKGTNLRLLGQLDSSLKAFFTAAELAKNTQHLKGEGEAYSAIADIYAIAGKPSNAKNYYSKSVATLRQSKPKNQDDSANLASVLSNAGDEFLRLKSYDSAFAYFNEAKIIFDKANNLIGKAYSVGNLGMIYVKLGKNAEAEKNLTEAIEMLEKVGQYYPVSVYLLSLADIQLRKKDTSVAVNIVSKSLDLAKKYGLKEQIRDASFKLSEILESTGDIGQAFKNYKLYILYRDSLNNYESELNMEVQRFDYEMSQKQKEVNVLNQQKRNERNLRIYISIILLLTIVILIILIKNNRSKQKAFEVLTKQKMETEVQKSKAEDALNELRLAQKQLIQSAKMASLGELTAGIAHEIKNPLNFVNNFSEVSVELLGELKEGSLNKLAASDKEDIEKIINDLTENLKKINYHGQRADSIVKGMLLHSRVSSDKKEAIDINTLLDEYLRLSYHGIRAKNKNFNVSMETTFDNELERILIVPQDIGRVLLNIFNNAFYSISQKTTLNIEGYVPKLLVITKGILKKDEATELCIKIRDNGMGISDNMQAKIFQPFFTTKPSGEGTGLGLSLSYDIIKAHDGELSVESVEGEYAEFTIKLPYKSN